MEFYTTIPHVFTRKSTPQVIETHEQLAYTVRTVEDLMQVATFNSKVAAAVAAAAAGESLLDAQYRLFRAPLSLVPKEARARMLVGRALTSTHAPTHKFKLDLVELFAFPEENRRPKPGEGPRRLLWHGSRLSNWVGILSDGLQIAPAEAPSSGYMFGKGLYFADVSSKSANYCFATPEHPDGLLLLCEVELGEYHEVVRAERDGEAICRETGFTSIMALGKSRPKGESPLHADQLHADYGVTMSLGPLEPNARAEELAGGGDVELRYNEYVVYDAERVHPRFLAHVRFDFSMD